MATDAELREAVASSRTYKDAATKLGVPYNEVYRRAHKLRVKPIDATIADSRKAEARAGAPTPRPDPFALREPVPESEPVRLSEWIEPSDEHRASYKLNIVLVRVDQRDRVRAQIMDRGDNFVAWCVRDSTGVVVGKMGLCPAIAYDQAVQLGKDGADKALAGYGWLRHRRETPHACTASVPLCAPALVIPDDNALRQKAEALLAAPRAQRADLGVELARMILTRVPVTQRPTP